jgi:hypothetical protein
MRGRSDGVRSQAGTTPEPPERGTIRIGRDREDELRVRQALVEAVPAQCPLHEPGARGGPDQCRAVEERVLLEHGRDVVPGGRERPGDGERLVDHRVRPPLLDDGHHPVRELLVQRPEHPRHHPGAGVPGELRARVERVGQHGARRDPAERGLPRDVDDRQLAGVHVQRVPAGGEQHVVPGRPERLRQRQHRDQMPGQRRGHHEHAHVGDSSAAHVVWWT